MDSIYSILDIDEGCSSGELKSAFLVWKKKQQEILKNGKPEEQRHASDIITEVTIQYKAIVKGAEPNPIRIQSTAKEEKSPEIKNIANVKKEDISERKAVIKVAPEGSAPKAVKEIVSVSNQNSYQETTQRVNNKALGVVIAMLICVGIGAWYMYDSRDDVNYNDYNDYSVSNTEHTKELPKKPEPPVPPTPTFPSDSKSNIQNENKVKDNSKSETKTSKPVTDEDFAKQVFVDYNNALGNHNFDEAYNLMSPNRQKSMGTPSNFAAGYADTLESKVSNMKLTQTNQDEMVFDYVLEAKDRIDGNKILYQTFNGQVHMFKVNGQWKVGYSESKKISEMIR